MECMDSISLEELIMAVRRQSQGFSRGTSTFRGVTHHPSGMRTPLLIIRQPCRSVGVRSLTASTRNHAIFGTSQ